MRRPDIPKILFVASCAVAVFAYGVAVGHYEIFPYAAIKFARESLIQLIGERDTLLGVRPAEFLEPARYKGDGVTRNADDRAQGALTCLTGFFKDRNEIRIIRADGSIVHRWPVKFFEMFPDTRHIAPSEVPNGEWNVAVHGSQCLPDGSVVFNFTQKGAAKIDRCGTVLWTLPQPAHHSVDVAADGGYWIPSARNIQSGSRYPNLKVPYVEDTILKVSEDGKILQELSVLEILYRNNLEGFIYRKGVTGDLTHLNDVEELHPSLAAKFPQFAAGDLLLSLRHQSMVLVVDPRTLRVKWYQAGPWIGQHDPIFMKTGKISVFSNNNDGTKTGEIFGGSTILEIDPQDRRIVRRYGGKPDQPMYTLDRGKHQRLGEQDEGILITESRSGRIVEIGRDGEPVWEYINRYDDGNVTILTGATRHSKDYFNVKDWSCR
jgi:hypothetical protein